MTVRRALEAAQLPVHSVAFQNQPDGGESMKTALAAEFDANFEPPLLFVKGRLVGRNQDGVSPHDYFQASIRFDGDTCPTFDGEMGIQVRRRRPSLRVPFALFTYTLCEGCMIFYAAVWTATCSQGSAELDHLIQRDMVEPAKGALQ